METELALVTRPLSAAAVVVAAGSRPEKPPLLRGGCGEARGGDLGILISGCARRADCAHDLAVDHDRQAAIHRRYAGQSLHARGRASGRRGILQGLGRSLDVVGRDRLAQRDLDAGELRVVGVWAPTLGLGRCSDNEIPLAEIEKWGRIRAPAPYAT